MATRAFVLIETSIGRNKDVINALREIKAVKSADVVTGPYDVIAVIEDNNLNDLGEIVTGKIQLIPGISRTVTCLTLG